MLARLLPVSELITLEEQRYEEFLDDVKRGDNIVLLRSEAELSELNTSFVKDTSVLDEKAIAVGKARFDARRGSAILKNPSDRYFDLGLPPERVCHEIDLKPGSDYAVLRQWALPQEQSDFIDAFFEEKRFNGLVRGSKSPHSAPTFCGRKPNGKWRIEHACNKLNAATIPAQALIPRKDVILHRMSGAKKFSALDRVDVYYQILIKDRDVPLTAVSTQVACCWSRWRCHLGCRMRPRRSNVL
ncbi:TPA: hypothetical protein N0F65_010852 [Lagenidium giganteum]|uniref:Reverse transcriptase n=1 Tax=Lagenidium giganteum TaxID=4803 RepID=A0AAV2Z606_9STRA|nr:TPA: hypothetical protein N0F65_010852 [Lagenidium giganteum]